MLTRIICVISLVCMGFSIALAEPTTKPTAKSVVALFDLAGDMTEQPAEESLPLFGKPALSLHEVITRIGKAAKDPDVKALVLFPDGAGVGQAQAAELRQALRNFRSAQKEVYVYSEGLGMTEFMLACGATRLSVAPTGEVWAIGLYGDQLYLHGLLTKMGIQPDFIHCGAYKSASELFMRDGPSPEADQMMNWIFDSIYDTSVNYVAMGRNVSPEQAKKWIDGGPYTAEKAKDLGMIDAVEDRAALESTLKERYGQGVVFDKKYGATKQPDLNLSNPFALMGVLAQMMNPPKNENGKPAVGVVYVEGPIVTGKADTSFMGSQVATGYDVAKALDEAANDDSVKAVVLRIDSPGGSVTASEIILHATQRVKAKKPLIVSMGNVAGSGGYYVTCASDTIFADDATITASIGVVGGKLSTTEMWNKIGVTWKPYQRGASADLLSTDTVWSPAQRDQMQNWMNEMYGIFKDHVTAARGSKLKKPLDELDGGRVFTGRQALDLGLVDRIGTFQDAIEFAADQAKIKEYDVRTVPEPKNFLQKLMEQSTGGDDDTDHVAMGSAGNWIVKLAEPFIAGLDPAHVRFVRMAMEQLQLIQHEQAIVMMPTVFCVKP